MPNHCRSFGADVPLTFRATGPSGGDFPADIVVPLSWNPVQQFVPGPNAHQVRLFTNAREGTLVGSFRHPVTNRLVIFSSVHRPLSGAIGGFMGPDHAGSLNILAFD